MKTTVNSDFYFNNQTKIKEQDAKYSKIFKEECVTVPVDLNAATVPTSKPSLMDISGLKDIQQNIRDRFSLDSDQGLSEFD